MAPSGHLPTAADRGDAIAVDTTVDRAGNLVGRLVPRAGNLAAVIDDVAGQLKFVVVAGATDAQHQAAGGLTVGVAVPAAQAFLDVVGELDGAAAGPGPADSGTGESLNVVQ